MSLYPSLEDMKVDQAIRVSIMCACLLMSISGLCIPYSILCSSANGRSVHHWNHWGLVKDMFIVVNTFEYGDDAMKDYECVIMNSCRRN